MQHNREIGSMRLYALSLPLIFFALIVIFAENIAPYNPNQISAETFQQPSWKHPMGTDDLGRDLLSNIIHGSRISLLIGLSVAFLTLLIGAVIGFAAGYSEGLIDAVLMRVAEIFQVIPRLILAIVITAALEPSLPNLIFAMTITNWPRTARIVRAQVKHLNQKLYVEASRALGADYRYILFSVMLPEIMPLLVVDFAYNMSIAILIESGISFMGLSDPRLVSWGRILANSQKFIYQGWWLIFFPGLVITAAIAFFNLVGDLIGDRIAQKRSFFNRS